MGKDYYTQNGGKITKDEFGRVHDSNGNHLGNVDEYGKFHSSQYGKGTASVDQYGNIIDGSGKQIGKVGGIGNDKITLNDSGSSSSSSGGSGFSFLGWLSDKIAGLGCGTIIIILVAMWVLGMIFCIAMGDAPWD